MPSLGDPSTPRSLGKGPKITLGIKFCNHSGKKEKKMWVTVALIGLQMVQKPVWEPSPHIPNHVGVYISTRRPCSKSRLAGPAVCSSTAEIRVLLEPHRCLPHVAKGSFIYFSFPRFKVGKACPRCLLPAMVPSSCKTELDHSAGFPNTASAFFLNSAKTSVLQTRVPILATTALGKKEGYCVILEDSPAKKGVCKVGTLGFDARPREPHSLRQPRKAAYHPEEERISLNE